MGSGEVNRDDIIRMAGHREVPPWVLKLVMDCVEAEREACAQILANTDLSGLRDHPLQNWVAGLLFEFIKAIRARNEQ
jgi:hypothetical protein